jgi:threonyl-tRNA synthetase
MQVTAPPFAGFLVQAMAVTNQSRAFWRGDVKREPLQRIYAITFPDPKQLKEYQYRMEEVRGAGVHRVHRVVPALQCAPTGV